MANKILKTRVQNKCDTAANWRLATNFKPLKGEIILYTDTKQMKVGDGNTLVNNLPFYPSGDVTAAGNNNFTGTNTFGSGNLQVGNDNTHITLNDNGIESGKIRLLLDSPSSGTFNYKFPCNKTVDEAPVNIVTENENNTFSGTNTFKSSGIKIQNSSNAAGPSGVATTTIVGWSGEGGGNNDFTLTLPKASGTIATQDYVQANPTSTGTATLTKLKSFLFI